MAQIHTPEVWGKLSRGLVATRQMDSGDRVLSSSDPHLGVHVKRAIDSSSLMCNTWCTCAETTALNSFPDVLEL